MHIIFLMDLYEGEERQEAIKGTQLKGERGEIAYTKRLDIDLYFYL